VIDVSAGTNRPRWDGLPVQYGAVVDALVSADGLDAAINRRG
jgi:hypothetical protein